MKKIKRSSKYDFFKSNEKKDEEKKSPKNILKLCFKWFRIVFYFALAGLSLTGCVQSLVIKTSTSVGSGLELYRSKNEIAPHVTTFQIQNEKDKDGNVSQKLTLLSKDNYLVSNVNGEIEKLQKQLTLNDKSYYGLYDNRSSSLRIINEQGEVVSTSNIDNTVDNQLTQGTKEEKSLIMNNFYLNELNKSSVEKYETANEIIEIPIFLRKRPDQKPADKEELKLYNSPTSIVGDNLLNPKTWQPYMQNPNGSNEYKPVFAEKKKDENNEDKLTGNLINPWNKSLIEPSTDEGKAIIEKFNYKFQFEKVILSLPTSSPSAVAFARDYLQSLANVAIQFDQFSEFDNTLPNQIASTETEIVKKRFDNLLKTTSLSFSTEQAPDVLTKEKLYSTKLRTTIEQYTNQILLLTSQTGFMFRVQSFDSEEEPTEWKTPYRMEFLPQNVLDPNEHLVLGSIESQKAIVSWGDAWGLGPFYGLVVYPLGYIVQALAYSMPNISGFESVLSISITVILVRLFTFLLTYKSAFAQAKQSSLAPKKAKIDAKYLPYKGNKAMEQRKRQEISELYKKSGINMFTPLLSALVSAPIFLAMWRIIQGIGIIKSTEWLGINFASTSWQELFAGAWQYLPLIILAALIQAGSQLVPRILNKRRLSERANVAEKEALKKNNRTQNIILAVFVFMAVIFQAGIQIYWIVGGIWLIGQALFVHYIQQTKIFKEKLIKYV